MILCYSICKCVDGGQLLSFWILAGFPFGFRRMTIFLVPRGLGISGDLGVFILDAILAGFIGGFFLVRKLIKIMAYYIEGIIGFIKYINR